MSDQNNIGHVKLPPSYYAKAKKDYADSNQAWFREAIQNEMDAGATQIDFVVKDHPEDSNMIAVVCHGNGRGMDLDKLLNVFLAMGGSQKEEGSIGGFGDAKVILAFAHQSYEIETHGIHVKGKGGDYTWTSGHPVMPGVRLSVAMDKSETRIYELEDALELLMKHSSLPSSLTITLNGQVMKGSEANHPYKQQTALGMLTFKDQPHGYSSSELWVRMRGLAMFREHLYSRSGTAFQGYLELEGHSTELLTTNRDSLNSKHRDILTQLMNTLATDREKLKLSGDIDMLLNPVQFSFQDLDEKLGTEVSQEAERQGLSADEMLARIDEVAGELESVLTDERIKNPFWKLAKDVGRAKSSMDSKLGKIPSHWYPDNFKVKFMQQGGSPENAHEHAADISERMKLKRYGKLAAGWDGIVRKLLSCEPYRESLRVISLGKNTFQHDGHDVLTGFVFGSPEGLCSREDEEKRVSIMLNPKIADDEKLSIGDLIDIAHHELTHLDVECHGEGFTIRESRLRRIMRREIGEATLIKAFEEACAQWRNAHSERKVVGNQKQNNKTEYNTSPGM